MDRTRLLLAFVLMMMVAIAPSIIWPPKKSDRRTVGQSDSLRVSDSSASPRATAPPAPSDGPTVRPSDADTGRIVWVTSPLYRLGFSTDRKSTRLNSSHSQISYAVFCLKKKKKIYHPISLTNIFT